MNGSQPAPPPDVRIEDGNLIVDFEGRCLLTIGRGSSFFTEADYRRMRGGFFASVLGEDLLCPEFGRRAYVAGIEQDIALFTTSDGWFDIRIEPRGTPQPVDVVGVARELSELYDRRANPQGGANGSQPFSSETSRTSAAAASRRSP